MATTTSERTSPVSVGGMNSQTLRVLRIQALSEYPPLQQHREGLVEILDDLDPYHPVLEPASRNALSIAATWVGRPRVPSEASALPGLPHWCRS